MKSYRRGRGIGKIVFLLILIAALSVGGLLWFDFLGIINAKERLAPLTSLVGVRPATPVEAPLSPMLLDADRLARERQAIAIERQELVNLQNALDARSAEIEQLASDVAVQTESVADRQNSLNQAVNMYDNKVANLEQQAQYMAGMPPEDAVAIMDNYNVMDLVDLLRTSERLSAEAGQASLVSYWISLMPDRARAAEIQKMMIDKPGISLE